MYSIEMAYARMREMQDQANRSRAAQQSATSRTRRRLGRAAAKKR